jgi:hypothetical protein
MQRPPGLHKRNPIRLSDRKLRQAAAELLEDARRQVPGIGAALEATAKGLARIVIEVVVSEPLGVSTSIVIESGRRASRACC